MVQRVLSAIIAWTLMLIAAAPAKGQQILAVSPALPTSADQVTVNLSVVVCSFMTTTVIQGSTINIYPELSEPCPPLAPPNPGVATEASFGPLAPGSYTINVVANGKTTDTRALFVQKPTTQLSFLDVRFSASVTWNTGGEQGASTAQAVQLSDSSGYFWFFDKDDAEVTLRMMPGFGQYYWVFVSSATNVAFTLTVVDTWRCIEPAGASCISRTYQNPAGTNQNILDFTAFTYD